MPTQSNPATDNATVSVIINGKVHSDWSRYQIDSDFLIPADAWSVSLGLPDGIFPAGVSRGAPVQVKVGNDTVLTGRIDSVRRDVARESVSLALTGRDDAAILVDCSAPILTSRQVSLEDVVAQIVRPLGITKIRIDAESSIRADKVSAEPGERAWDMLLRVCAARGLWPWFSPDGTLVVGGPDYTRPPVASLIMRRDGRGNNILSLAESSTIERSFSELTVLAQGHAHSTKSSLAIIDVDDDSVTTDDSDIDISAGTAETGQHGMKAVVKDPTVSYYRPQILVVGDADNQEQIDYRARKAMSDARLAGYNLTATVYGHRTSDGVLWEPGQRIHVISEPHDIDDVFFLIGREFNGGRPGGTTTTLRLKEDGVWIPDAYQKKKKQRERKGKKELQIVDVG
ncbi:phage baseplate assembly protein [Pectobacterium actinidiae]|uniref:Phage baseplate assembly protein n=1 Tax=Pectobacterium actinidiae TaxID=1507808 RepID=A0ABW8G7E0_9GAMM